MKILLITKTLSEKDGQGRYCLGLINEYSQNHNVTIISPDHNEALSNVTFINAPNLNLKKDLRSFLEFRKIVRSHAKNCDVVHFCTDLPRFLIFSTIKTKPYFLTAHGTYAVSSLDHKFYKYLVRGFYKKAKKIICVSSFTQSEILKRIKLDNTVVINNGVDFEKFNKNIKEENTSDHKKNILSVGALKNRKGFDISIKAIAKLKSKYPDLSYTIVGNQSDKNYYYHLRNIVEKSDLKDNVRFIEKVSDQELLKLYSEADIFVLTPKVIKENKFEGFGLVYLEAGACKIPIVASAAGGVIDVVKDSQNGLVVPPDDVNATADAIDEILSDKALAIKLGQNGYELAKSNDWQEVSKKYLKLYESFTD
ncbi:glycosyltransferase family 4 protein [Patescibacteria group bacterium]|nr:glycosyltransferase family 4 protein [Patescibacteria group bacterium]